MARVLAFSIAATVLASTAHYLGHGQFPSVPIMLALAPTTGCIGLVLSRTTRGPWSIGLGLTFGQALVHLLLSNSSSPCLGHSGHAAHELATSVTACTSHTAAPGGRMLLWHGLATMATAAILAFGEKTLARLGSFFKPSLPQRPGNFCLAINACGYTEPPQERPRVAAGGCCRRGPPRLGFAL